MGIFGIYLYKLYYKSNVNLFELGKIKLKIIHDLNNYQMRDLKVWLALTLFQVSVMVRNIYTVKDDGVNSFALEFLSTNKTIKSSFKSVEARGPSRNYIVCTYYDTH